MFCSVTQPCFLHSSFGQSPIPLSWLNFMFRREDSKPCERLTGWHCWHYRQPCGNLNTRSRLKSYFSLFSAHYSVMCLSKSSCIPSSAHCGYLYVCFWMHNAISRLDVWDSERSFYLWENKEFSQINDRVWNVDDILAEAWKSHHPDYTLLCRIRLL